MNKLIIPFLLCIGYLSSPVNAGPVGKIKKVIALMLENRSFDHMLGYLKKLNKDINGCLPNEDGCSNPVDPTITDSPQYTVDDSAVYVQISPHHSIDWTTEQIYGSPKEVIPPEGAIPYMNGFIKAYQDSCDGQESKGIEIMQCFAPEHVPIISTLAQEFAVFDGWFASIPGPTMVNRAYAASGTSHGMGTNDEVEIAKGYPQKTMFRQLQEMGLDYKVYFQDVPSVLQFKDMRHRDARPNYSPYTNIFDDLAAGNMPAFTWIEPAYFSSPRQAATDQHPDHDVGEGEKVMKDLYEAIRASPIWEETLFIITYDEHGGFFDHVSPPENVPNPDGMNATDDPFDFTRLGVRVPTLLISPWIKKGTIISAPQYSSSSSSNSISSRGGSEGEETPSQYDHTSIISTVVHKLFESEPNYPAPEYLTKRDAWSKTFEWVVDTVEGTTPRADCPVTLPEVYSQVGLTVGNATRGTAPSVLPPQDGSQPLSDLQMELLSLVRGVTEDNAPGAPATNEVMETWTEAMGAYYVYNRMEKYFSAER